MLGNKVAGSHSLTLYFFPMLWKSMATSKDILKNVGKQTVSGPYWHWLDLLTILFNFHNFHGSQWLPATVWKIFGEMWPFLRRYFHGILCPYYGSQWIAAKIFCRYFEECGYANSILFPYYGSQWLPSALWLPAFFKISSPVFNRRKTPIQVWGGVNDDTFFIPGWTIP